MERKSANPIASIYLISLSHDFAGGVSMSQSHSLCLCRGHKLLAGVETQRQPYSSRFQLLIVWSPLPSHNS